MFTPPNAPYQDTRGNASPITRSPDDWLARRFGTYTNTEAKKKQAWYEANKMAGERQNHLSKAMSRAVDLIMTTPNPGHEIGRLIGDLQQRDQFTGNEIKEGLKRELMKKYIEVDQRNVGQGKSSRQAHIEMWLQQLR